MDSFTPVSALIGGALIGLSASLFTLFHGKIAGISGIFADLVSPGRRSFDRSIGLYFLGGLLLAGGIARFVHPSALPSTTPSLAVGAVAGLLVGFGTRLGSGCTSGHGVCGLSRLSTRSLVATLTFIAAGMATVAAVRVLGGAV
ncbi:MAG: YeeE/YedE thiosulfate transporter family protein [Byssovorax sp.]